MIEAEQNQEDSVRFHHWPKIALHRHLPGSIRIEQWWQIVQDRGVSLPSNDPEQLRSMMTVRQRAPLKEYLKCFDIIDLAFVDVQAIEQLTYEVIADAAAENIIYLELRYSPTRMAHMADISTTEALLATISGCERALQDFNIDAAFATAETKQRLHQRLNSQISEYRDS